MRILALLAGMVAVCMAAGDVSGNWSGTFIDSENQSHSIYMVLKQDGATLTGSGGPDAEKQHPMQNGKIAGDKLTFEVSAGGGTFYFDLKVAENEITGDLQFKEANQTRAAKVSLKRAGS
jgi:hypothetical protein